MRNSKNHLNLFFDQISLISQKIDLSKLEKIAKLILNLRKSSGRLFFVGVGGSAANCSHAVNDFRKLCGIDTLTPLDNVAELTANINDEGWENSILNYLKISKMNKNDILFILSVGGGNFKKNVSVNLIKSIQFANKNKTKVVGICGKENGYLQKKGDLVLIVPNINNSLVTPYSESFQSIILHSLVSDPRLQIKNTKW